MTFKEAIATGYRVKRAYLITKRELDYFYKKIDNKYVIDELGNKYEIESFDDNLIWYVHPDDQKLIDFNKKLEEILK